MVLGQLPVPGHPTIWMIVGQGPIVLCAGCLNIFTLLCPFSPLSPSLWETARYRLKYRLKEPLNPNQSINHNFRVLNRALKHIPTRRIRENIWFHQIQSLTLILYNISQGLSLAK